MDGFIGSDNVVVMASTNRPSVLDEALLRSGRFDLQVHFEPPDIRAREKLFLLYTRHMNVTTFILGDKDIGDGSKDLVLNSSTLAGDGDGQIRSLDAQPSRCLKWIATRFFTAMISALPYRHIRPPIPTEISPGHKLLAKELAGLTPGCVGAGEQLATLV
jgi:SpoVK/Ycf46/Vps4 family AAA+-type ATPase